MSHINQKLFIKKLKEYFPECFLNKKVLEIGSLNINGTVRDVFTNCDYLGVDLGPGKDVDMICKGHELPFSVNSFDIVISCECLEHDVYWDRTFKKMCDLSKDLVIMTCATLGRREHGTTSKSPESAPFTNDYYRNLVISDFVNLLDLHSVFKDFSFTVDDESHDIYFWGRK